jgi:hypothetical protein
MVAVRSVDGDANGVIEMALVTLAEEERLGEARPVVDAACEAIAVAVATAEKLDVTEGTMIVDAGDRLAVAVPTPAEIDTPGEPEAGREGSELRLA